MKNIYLIVGPSGSGKSTIAGELSKRYDLKEVCSYTERPPRYEGEPGHIFVTPEQFDAAGEMCAFTFYNGYRYGVPKSMIEESDLYVIDPAGVRYMSERYRGSKGVVVVAVWESAEERERRMLLRGDAPEQVAERLRVDEVEFARLRHISNIMLRNDDLDLTVKAIHAYIEVMEGKYEQE